MNEKKSISFPIDGILDLHTFRPEDVKDLVPEYLEECRRRRILFVRIIHGKGTGTLRHIVHNLLENNPGVLSYKTPDPAAGGWGATEIKLKP